MRKGILKKARKLTGKQVYIVRQDGSRVTGRLVSVRGNTAYIAPRRKKGGKAVQTKCILAIALLGIVAIGAFGFWGGGGGCGCGCGGGGFSNCGGPNQGFGFGSGGFF